MKNRKLKLNSLLLSLAAIVFAVLLGALSFIYSADVFASGNLAGDPSATPHLTISLDVNGKDNSQTTESDKADYDTNNSAGLRSRSISKAALIATANINNVDVTWNIQSGSIVNAANQSVTITEIIGAGNAVTGLKFTALKAITDARASVLFTDGVSEERLYIKIVIGNTFRPATAISTTDKTFYVGEKNPIAGQAWTNAPILELYNNATADIDIAAYLNDRALYRTGAAGADPILIEEVAGGACWTIKDSTSFSVIDLSIPFVEPTWLYLNPSPDFKFSPTVSLTLNISSRDIAKYDEQSGTSGAFWSTTHYLEISLTDSAFTTTIQIPTQILALGTTPVISRNKDFEKATALNCSSDQTLTTIKEIEIMTNFESVYVFADYLVDYAPSPEFGFSYLDIPVKSNDGIISVSVVQNARTQDINDKPIAENNSLARTAYKVTGLTKGSTEVIFKVTYATSRSIEVSVTFTVYGDYEINPIAINNGKIFTLNALTDSRFAPMRADGFYLTGVTQTESDALSVSINNNIIQLVPNKDANNVPVTFIFKNHKGQEVRIPTFVNVNIKANDLIKQWGVWAYVFFVGMGILGLLLIALIIWFIIHTVSKHRQDELATSAPTSAYIIKLNATIAAAQAQQRLQATAGFNTVQTQMLQLGAGAGSTSQAAPVNTLQLQTGPTMAAPPPPSPVASEPASVDKAHNMSTTADDDIYIPMSDDQLLERIYVEKYEPRGVSRRSFFKGKDLQARELEKEKARIRENVRNGMSIEDAMKTEKELEAERSGQPVVKDEAEELPKDEISDILGFDPNAPLVVTETNESKIVIAADGSERIEYEESSDEEARLAQIERKAENLEREMKEIKARMDKALKEFDKSTKVIDDIQTKKERIEKENQMLATDIENLEVKMATAKGKDKEKINKDIQSKEERIKRNKEQIEKLNSEYEDKNETNLRLKEIVDKYTEIQNQTSAEAEANKQEVETAKEAVRKYNERILKEKQQQEAREKLSVLEPMLLAANVSDQEIRRIENQVDQSNKEKADLKSQIAGIQNTMLSKTDPAEISSLNSQITGINKRISEIDKEITQASRRKSDLSLELNSQRRKANDYIEKNDIPIEDVLEAENTILGKIALEEYKNKAENEKAQLEDKVAKLQATYDDLISNNTTIADAALKSAEVIKQYEDELASVQLECELLQSQMDAASDDEKLMLSVDQMELNERLEKAKEKLEEAKAQGIKSNLEAKMQYEQELNAAHQVLEEAQAEYDAACSRLSGSEESINPLDFIMPGSGIVSQDQKKIEAENLKKQLEKSKNAIEQAKLQAQMAEMEAQKAIIEAQRASDASKAEAEKLAKEAVERAEQARHEAEAKAQEEAEKARLAAEEAKRAAEEEAERIRLEAEEVKRKAQEEAEEAKRKAQEETEEAKRKAQEETEEAKRKAQEEAEEAKRKMQEEAEEAKRKAEEEAQEKARQEQERQARINEKVAKRKTEIMGLRAQIKFVKDEESGRELHEKFYSILHSLDEEEKSSTELTDLLNKSMDDSTHAAERAMYKELANRKNEPAAPAAAPPRRTVKKVTERVNKIPRPAQGGARSGGARPRGARPAGARPAGARPAGARPAGARPGGARPAGARPGSRPQGKRPPPR